MYGYYACHYHSEWENGKKHRISTLMHRVILERMVGRKLEPREHCDHINENKLDNRRSNLRVATHGQNQQNRRTQFNNTSGVKGVSWNKRKNHWHAEIQVNNKKIFIGCFKDLSKATVAVAEARKKYHGEFANNG
jgi:hypothetical protein